MTSPYREPSENHRSMRCILCGASGLGERCPSCGAPAPDPSAPRADALEVECPRCGGMLEHTRFTELGAGFVYCVKCHGCFVPPGDWAAMLDGISAFGPVPGDELGRPSDARRAALEGAVACPVCRGAMERVRFANEEALPVDMCILHGVWFDATELAVGLRAVRSDEHVVVRPAPTRAPAAAPRKLDAAAFAPSPAPSRLGAPALGPAPEARSVLDAVVARLLEIVDS